MAVSSDMIGSVIMAQYFGEHTWTSEAERSRFKGHGHLRHMFEDQEVNVL